MTNRAEMPTFEHSLTYRDSRLIDSTLSSVPPASAMWCNSCERIFTLPTDCCPLCQSKELFNVASLLMARFTPTFEHHLSDRDRKRIARTLRPLRDGVDHALVLEKIEIATKLYFWNIQCEKEFRQSRKEMRNDLLQVAVCAEQLLCAMNRLRPDAKCELRSTFETLAYLNALIMERPFLDCDVSAFAAAYPELEITSVDNRSADNRKDKIFEKVVRMFDDTIGRMASLEQLRYGIAILQVVAGGFDPRGRPRLKALNDYVKALVFIYANATGSKPRRRYNDCRPGEAEHLPFFAACMTAARVDKYPSRIIRRVIEETSFDPENPDLNVRLDRSLFASFLRV